MKIEGPKSTGPGRVSQTRGSQSAGAAQATPSARQIADSASIMGIPETEITPKVREALMALMEEVARLRDELQRSQGRIQHLEQLADQDSLLPINNRRAFVRELNRAISMSERYSYPSTVVYFDVDNMKTINDRLGHPAGDAALTFITERLQENVRDSDIIGRLGGDEFGVILLQADEEQGQQKAQQLADSIQNAPFHFGGEEVDVGVTWGLYTFSGQDDASGALAAADEAMYAAQAQPHLTCSRARQAPLLPIPELDCRATAPGAVFHVFWQLENSRPMARSMSATNPLSPPGRRRGASFP